MLAGIKVECYFPIMMLVHSIFFVPSPNLFYVNNDDDGKEFTDLNFQGKIVWTKVIGQANCV